jgi:tripartite-type tricarboxylate transporter receptor subunit TctC
MNFKRLASSRRGLHIAGFIGLAAVMSVATSAVAAWPEKPVKIVVPYAPGGTTDIAARLIAKKLSDAYKQQFVVENRAGANTQIGTDAVAKAAPDGYTFLLTAAPFAVNAALYAKQPYNPLTDFEPITMVVQNSMILAVNPLAAEKSLKDIVASAKTKELHFASAGGGSISHMSLELLGALSGGNIRHVAYKGSGQAIPDLLGNNVSFMFDNPSSIMPHVKSGKLVALAYTGPKRSAALPNVPTMAEAGVAGFETINWFGLFAPAKTPVTILDQMNVEVGKALRAPDVAEIFTKDGVDVSPGSREAFGRFVKSEIDKWTKIVKERNIKVD